MSYETSIKSGRFVLVFHGTDEEVERARGILIGAKALDTAMHGHVPAAAV